MFPADHAAPAVADLRNHRDDYEWLATHLDEIHREIRHKLQSIPVGIDALEMLNLVMPYAMTRQDYLRWEPLLYEGLHHAMNLRDEEFLIRLWANLGESHLQFGHYRTATEAFAVALKRANRHAGAENILLARIGLLRSTTIFKMGDVEQFIADTLQMTQAISDLSLIARMHYSLAVAYTHRAETQKALGHTQIAYVCWHRLGNSFEKNRAILIAAEACRVAFRFDQAMRYQNAIQARFEQDYDEALYIYQRGALLLEMERFEEARAWLEQALERCLKLDRPYMVGAARHALGLVLTRLGLFDQSYQQLRRALVIWQKIENRYQQAELVYALGDWHFRQGQREQARALYLDALELSQSIVESPLLTGLRHRIQEDLEQLDSERHAGKTSTT